jgi:hypothetical protein
MSKQKRRDIVWIGLGRGVQLRLCHGLLQLVGCKPLINCTH